jgi:hypothetical protein
VLVNRMTLRGESGNAMVLAVFMMAALVLLSVSLVNAVRGDSSRSSRAVVSDAAFHAAEAGIDDYTSKLVVDNQFFFHDVAAGESTRCSGSQRVSSTSTDFVPWSLGLTWTYCSGKDNWRQLSNGYEYNLQVTGTSQSKPYADIIATGRKHGTASPVRVLEVQIHPSSVADFQMIANADISYGSGAETRGKVYVGTDSGGTKHSVTFQSGSKAYANVYAENQVNMSGTLVSPAKAYDRDSNPNIRSVIKSPISFSSFAGSISTVQQAASTDSPSMSFDDSSKDAWQLTFNSNGTVSVKSCVKYYTTDYYGRKTYYPVDQYAPTCGSASTYNVPAKGAIYTAQTAIIAGSSSSCSDPDLGSLSNPASCVQGRVTVASGDDIVIGANLGHVADGDDVFGLIAKNNVRVAQWAPCPLKWRAATIAQTGSWSSADSWTGNDPRTCNSSMTFDGSSATNLGGSMSQFASREYDYDTTLSYLSPPWFPVIDSPYTVQLFRELPSG